MAQPSRNWPLPFIFWGGDVATFLANGGLDTKPDTTFGKLGLYCEDSHVQFDNVKVVQA